MFSQQFLLQNSSTESEVDVINKVRRPMGKIGSKLKNLIVKSPKVVDNYTQLMEAKEVMFLFRRLKLVTILLPLASSPMVAPYHSMILTCIDQTHHSLDHTYSTSYSSNANVTDNVDDLQYMLRGKDPNFIC